MITSIQIEDLQASIELWSTRAHGEPCHPDVRQAANTIIEIVDEMLQQLYLLRGRTISQAREHDDLYHAHLDALLAERRALK